MKIPSTISAGRLFVGMLTGAALLGHVSGENRPDRDHDHDRDHGAPPHAPVHATPPPVHVRDPAPPHTPPPPRPVIVDPGNHGTIRHAEPRPGGWHPEPERDHHVYVHHDAEADFGHRHFWHDFHYGLHVGLLRPGHLRIVFGGLPYFYDDGIYYRQVGTEYEEIYPPVGIGIPQLPDGAVVIVAGNLTYYFAGGAFYVDQGGTYVIAAAPMGVIVPELPPGAVTVSVGGTAAYQFNGIYYRPVFVNGVTQYQTFLP